MCLHMFHVFHVLSCFFSFVSFFFHMFHVLFFLMWLSCALMFLMWLSYVSCFFSYVSGFSCGFHVFHVFMCVYQIARYHVHICNFPIGLACKKTPTSPVRPARNAGFEGGKPDLWGSFFAGQSKWTISSSYIYIYIYHVVFAHFSTVSYHAFMRFMFYHA